MLEPARAIVRPRIQETETGGTVPLESEVASLLETHDCGAIAILGGMGSGRTTALKHLAALIPQERKVVFLDKPTATAVAREEASTVVIYAAQRTVMNDHIAVFHLAPWELDDLIEYCRAVHPEQCGSILSGVMQFTDAEKLEGKPALWRAVLDTLAQHEAMTTIDAALEAILAQIYQGEFREVAQDFCFGVLLATPESRGLVRKVRDEGAITRLYALSKQIAEGRHKGEIDLLRYNAVRLLMAKDYLLDSLRSAPDSRCCAIRLPEEIVRRAAAQIRHEPPLIERLLKILNEKSDVAHPVAASLLHFAFDWRADSRQVKKYSGGYFQGAQWSGAELSEAKFENADLSDADLSNAKLFKGHLRNARIVNAKLVGADLRLVIANGARFFNADLSACDATHAQFEEASFAGACFKSASLRLVNFKSANLTRASFLVANLTHADFQGAKIDNADFTGAILDHAQLHGLCLRTAIFQRARFAGATMWKCDCSDVALPNAVFSDAWLEHADFTGSSIPNGDFANAHLRGATLGYINWPNANLLGADLSGVTFHMGSTRTGHVNSVIASEGSKTGFYTDEFHEQGFKAPEEIRKANLCGADFARGEN